MEIIDNERELKGFHNIDEVIKLVGYFKSEKSPRTSKTEPQMDPVQSPVKMNKKNQLFLSSVISFPPSCFLHPDFIEYDDAAEEFHPFIKFYATFDPKV